MAPNLGQFANQCRTLADATWPSVTFLLQTKAVMVPCMSDTVALRDLLCERYPGIQLRIIAGASGGVLLQLLNPAKVFDGEFE